MRTRHVGALPFFVLGALAACGASTTSGSGSGASGSATGSVGGVSLSVSSVVAGLGGSTEETGGCAVAVDGGNPTCGTSSFSQQVDVVFTNRSDATCAAIQSEAASNTTFEFANLDELVVAVNVANGDVVPGTYAIGTDSTVTTALAAFNTFSATCAPELSLTASSGTVTLTQVSSTRVTGTYSITFGAQGTFSGSFDVPICDFDAGGSSGPPKQVCQP